ncbi:HD domain-containing protein [Moritella marina ATCC 15381]|uniref:HD domain-containing protein n=1 Tax=Moritella marina ATCC 15381 TaxID=1202962 RepID=A0A5J6WP81_MORMI|nr:HD domain-containing protein [Moritella marina]QFI39131.1 HD domain-containing protein [Moritella marina ATCC 15381]
MEQRKDKMEKSIVRGVMTSIDTAMMLRRFMADAEMLKKELRHSSLSDGRMESVADHVWRMSLLGIMIVPYISQKLDVLRFLKIIIVHDLVEIYAGDMPITESSTNAKSKKIKEASEKKAIEKIRVNLPAFVGDDIYNLWWEYESNSTYESKIAHALDKIEAQAQHNEAGIETWVEEEYHFAYKLPNYTMNEKILEDIASILVKEVDNMLDNIKQPDAI